MGKKYPNSILTTAGFTYNSKQPLDDREVVENKSDLSTLVSNNCAYEGLHVYVTTEKKTYRYDGKNWDDLSLQKDVTKSVGELTEAINKINAAIGEGGSDSPDNSIISRVESLEDETSSNGKNITKIGNELNSCKNQIADLQTDIETTDTKHNGHGESSFKANDSVQTFGDYAFGEGYNTVSGGLGFSIAKIMDGNGNYDYEIYNNTENKYYVEVDAEWWKLYCNCFNNMTATRGMVDYTIGLKSTFVRRGSVLECGDDETGHFFRVDNYVKPTPTPEYDPFIITDYSYIYFPNPSDGVTLSGGNYEGGIPQDIREYCTDSRYVVDGTYIGPAVPIGNTYISRYSHTEGRETLSTGEAAHSEGYETTAAAPRAHSEGWGTQALGNNSHTEGYNTIATESNAHAEGNGTEARGSNSHTEGGKTVALARDTHAEGGGTIAASDHQHVQGRFNIPDYNTEYADIVGNGSGEDDRSNAYTLDWQGNAWYAGGITLGESHDKVLVDKYIEIPNKFEFTQDFSEIPSNWKDGKPSSDGFVTRTDLAVGDDGNGVILTCASNLHGIVEGGNTITLREIVEHTNKNGDTTNVLHIVGASNSRLRMLNTITKNLHLTREDVGRLIKVSIDVMRLTETSSISFGVMGLGGGYNQKLHNDAVISYNGNIHPSKIGSSTPLGEWQTVEFVVRVDETMVSDENQAGLIAIAATGEYYIDNIRTVEVADVMKALDDVLRIMYSPSQHAPLVDLINKMISDALQK